MKLDIGKISGKASGKKINLSDKIFGIEPNDHAIYLDVKSYLTNQRQGNSKVKGRSDIIGSTRKIKKQKGTGTARAGSIKSPLFKGGGQIFGPQPRDYNNKLNKKVKNLARKSALSHKIKDKSLTIIENFTLKSPKTKDFFKILTMLSVHNKKSIFFLAETDKNLILSSNNITNTMVKNISDINTYDIMNADNVIFIEESITKLNEILK
ncbi:MAG: 50S ribosomal protein L4 [Amoebophilaceae bacterium TMED152]|nr:MAG: 50S ribosomal protein L4 [Amoebophilaceae bacterium TMED152]|tara:strand:+ start:1217 stop:1843 length:627 start_codon:yes stop_codon:yes gene_type:complete